MQDTIIPVSKVRTNIAKLIKQTQEEEQPVIITQRSKPQAVLVSHSYFMALEEAILDQTDSIEAEKAKNEPTIPFSQYTAKRWKE